MLIAFMAHMRRASLFVALAFLSGCTVTKYSEAPGGAVTFSRTSFLNNAKVARLERSTNGLVLEGYVNDQISGVAAVTEAAVKGAVKGAK